VNVTKVFANLEVSETKL